MVAAGIRQAYASLVAVQTHPSGCRLLHNAMYLEGVSPCHRLHQTAPRKHSAGGTWLLEKTV